MAVWILRSVWTGIAFCGLIFNGALLGRSINDYKIVLGGGRNGLRKYAAVTSIIVFFGSTELQLSFTVAGIISLTQTPQPDNQPASIQQYFIYAIFVLAIISTAITSLIVFYRRRRLVEMIFEDGHNKENSG